MINHLIGYKHRSVSNIVCTVIIDGLLTHVAVYYEFSNQSSCRIWGCCTFPNCVQWFGGGSGALDSEHSNSNYGNTNIFLLQSDCLREMKGLRRK